MEVINKNNYSITKSLRKSLIEGGAGPNPCSYNIPSNFGKEGPRTIINGRPRIKFEATPGPGLYNPSFDATIEKSPRFLMSKGPRSTKSFYDNPGPGQYKYKTGLNGPKFKFAKSKRLEMNVDTIPAPGSYKIPCTFAKVADYELRNTNNEFRFV